MRRLVLPYDFLLDAPTGWRAAQLDRLSDRGALELAPRVSRDPLTDPEGTFGGHTLPRGAAVHGDCLFVADPPRHRILVWHPCCPAAPLPLEPGPGAEPRQLDTPTGLAATCRGDLVVADTGNRRLLVFSLPGLLLRRIVASPGEPSWQPVDVAAGRAGRLYVADAAGSRVWRLDRRGRPDPVYAGALPAPPRRLAVDRDGRAWVLTGSREIVLLDPWGHRAPLPGDLPVALSAALPPSPLGLDGDRVTLRPAGRCTAHRAPLLTGFAVDASGRLVLTEAGEAPFLLARPEVIVYESDGLYLTRELDSRQLGNPWHRVVLELTVPERTSVRLFSLTGDVPRPGLDARELLAAGPPPGLWREAPANADEWLIQSPPGRFLTLALVFRGPGNVTPRVERIYVHARRESSLRFLPAVYQEDETSRHLLDRLLSLTDTIFAEIETAIEDFPRHLDVRGAPAGFLPWLASWFGLTFEAGWSERQRRAFLAEVVTLWRWRGTVRGLRRLLQLHGDLSGSLPAIVEHHRGASTGTDESPGRVTGRALRRWLGAAAAGDDLDCFTVLLPAPLLDPPEQRAAVVRLIDAYKPAHTHYTLRPLRSGVRLAAPGVTGGAIGIDTLLGSLPVWRLPAGGEGGEALGAGTILPPRPRPRSAVRLGDAVLGAAASGCRSCSACDDSGDER